MTTQKIFCVGLSRSGTTSFHHAVRQLGLKSIHFPFQLYSNRNAKILDKVEVFSDAPIPMIYQELDQRYPNSKFVLTKRNKTAWLKSMEWMLSEGKAKWWWGYDVHEYHQKFYGTKRFDAEILSEKYDRYHAEVDRYFEERTDDLLELNLDHGVNINTLCSFLDIPKKNIAFPNRNSRKKVPLARKIAYKLYSTLFVSPAGDRVLKSLKKRAVKD